MSRFESDAIDECCQELFGHDNWAYGEQDSEKTTAHNEKQVISKIKPLEKTKSSRVLPDKVLEKKVKEKLGAKPSTLTPPKLLNRREDKVKAKASALTQPTLPIKNPDKKDNRMKKGSVEQVSSGQKTERSKQDPETLAPGGSNAGSGKPMLLKPLALTPKNNKQAPSRSAAPETAERNRV